MVSTSRALETYPGIVYQPLKRCSFSIEGDQIDTVSSSFHICLLHYCLSAECSSRTDPVQLITASNKKEVEQRHAETAVKPRHLTKTALTIHLPSPRCPAISFLDFVTALTNLFNLLRCGLSASQQSIDSLATLRCLTQATIHVALFSARSLSPLPHTRDARVRFVDLLGPLIEPSGPQPLPYVQYLNMTHVAN